MLLMHCRVFTHDPEQPFFEDGAVLVRDNVIEAVGEREALCAAWPDEERVDMNGRLVMPGLINTHSHIYSANARGMSNPRPTRDFIEILENLWWTLDKRLTLEDTKLSAYHTMIESIRNGVTTLIDHHAAPNHLTGSLDVLADAAEELGLRVDLCYELSDRDGKAIRDQGVEENAAFIRRCKDKPSELLRAHFGLHASFTLSDESLELTRRVLEETGAGIHCHVAEGIADERRCVEEHGCRVVERLERFGLLGPKSMLIHLCHVNPREMDIMAMTDCVAVHNPQSNMGNAVGRTPLLQLLERGILVGLGTDAYTNDMWISAANAKTLLSHDLSDPTKGFGEAYQLLIENNPKIIGRFWERPAGVLKKGAYADIIALDYTPFTPLNENTIAGHMIFGFSGRLCTDNMINGRFVMRDRKILNVDETAVAAACRERTEHLWKEFQTL